MSDDLASYLLARYDERERDASSIHEMTCAVPANIDNMPDPAWCDCGEPDRIRADVEAKRRIVEQAQWHSARNAHHRAEGMVEIAGESAVERMLMWTLRALAQPYATRDDFRQEWKQ